MADVDALHQVIDWPADHVAAAIVRANGDVSTIGDPDRRYRLASLTKPLAAHAVLIGVEEGVIALDDEVPDAQAGCTYRHLLSHAGGYPFEGTAPVATPGTRRLYSNTGFELLAGAFAAMADIDFDVYVHEAVFEPLQMTSTTLVGSPAHGATSTVGDLVHLLGEHLRPRLVHVDTATAARTAQFPDLAGIVPGIGQFDPCPWGLGVEIAGHKSPHWTGTRRSTATFGHFGGAGTMMWVDPDAEVALVALTDLPFDRWAAEALRAWSALSDAVLADTTGDTASDDTTSTDPI